MMWVDKMAAWFAAHPMHDREDLVHWAITTTIAEAIREVYDAKPFTRAEVARRLRTLLTDDSLAPSAGPTASGKE
jgi:hypothetical protein